MAPGQLRLWFFSGCTNVPAFTGLVPRPTKLFYDVFPALSGQGSGMLSPGGNLELRALHDWGGDKADQRAGLGLGRQSSVCRAERACKVLLLAKRGIYPNFWVTQKTVYPTATVDGDKTQPL